MKPIYTTLVICPMLTLACWLLYAKYRSVRSSQMRTEIQANIKESKPVEIKKTDESTQITVGSKRRFPDYCRHKPVQQPDTMKQSQSTDTTISYRKFIEASRRWRAIIDSIEASRQCRAITEQSQPIYIGKNQGQSNVSGSTNTTIIDQRWIEAHKQWTVIGSCADQDGQHTIETDGNNKYIRNINPKQ